MLAPRATRSIASSGSPESTRRAILPPIVCAWCSIGWWAARWSPARRYSPGLRIFGHHAARPRQAPGRELIAAAVARTIAAGRAADELAQLVRAGRVGRDGGYEGGRDYGPGIRLGPVHARRRGALLREADVLVGVTCRFVQNRAPRRASLVHRLLQTPIAFEAGSGRRICREKSAKICGSAMLCPNEGLWILLIPLSFWLACSFEQIGR